MDPAPSQNKKVGKTMLFIGWILFLLLLISFFGNWEEAKINPNQKIQSSSANGSTEVILQRNSLGHYLLNGKVNGVTVTFLIDTGASQLVFTEAQARKAGLAPGRPYSVGTANGNIRVYSTEVETLEIGEIRLHQLPAAINPHMDGYALLGMSALVNLEWSQKGDQLIIRQ